MMRRLPAAHREALLLTDLGGIDQAAAARRVGVSVSGMKSRIQRGRRQLRTLLEACCRIDLDSRGGIVAYRPRDQDSCPRCDGDRPAGNAPGLGGCLPPAQAGASPIGSGESS
jgi:RNA polymerase sigma-70 factor (ECF subfamily)